MLETFVARSRWAVAVFGGLAGAVTLSVASDAALLRAAAAKSGPDKPTLATFAGTWSGHTRSLTITRAGHGRESIGDGCCDPTIALEFQLSRPRGTSRDATAIATVVAVRVLDPGVYTKKYPAPQLGEKRELRLEDGVITDRLTGSTYCDAPAESRGKCGA